MNLAMPVTFPIDEFRAFGVAANTFLPKLLSDEDLNDPLARKRHFDLAWQAVRYRYRGCSESNEEFRTLLANPSELWRAGWDDEELMYKLERCIYVFFMSGLSVFESLGFCLYFLGGALRPSDFPHIANPKKINLTVTSEAFTAAFPDATISSSLAELLRKLEFVTVHEIRNLLAHRLSGRRSVCTSSDGRGYKRKEGWHIPGSSEEQEFDRDMLQRHMSEITAMLTVLTAAAREFAESQSPARGA